MKRIALAIALIVMLFSISAFADQGPGINKDVTNVGTITAYDVSVVLKGEMFLSL